MNENEILTLSKKELRLLYKISSTTLWRVVASLNEPRLLKKRVLSGSDLQRVKNAIETR
jgi:hypothetical protein